MPNETPRAARRHQRISLPQGMSVAWDGGGQQQVSRVKSLRMGGLSLCGSITLRVGSDLTIVFEVPGGMVMPERVFRKHRPWGWMSGQFTKRTSQMPPMWEGVL